MKATAIKSINKAHQLIKTGALLTVTMLFLTGGTAYANHRHHDGNSGLSISLGYVYYPKARVYEDAYRYPRHVRYYDNHNYRGHHGHRGHHKSWKNKHAYKHHGRHHGKHHGKRHHDY